MISAKETSSYLVSLTSVCSQSGSTAVTRVSQIKLTNNKKTTSESVSYHGDFFYSNYAPIKNSLSETREMLV